MDPVLYSLIMEGVGLRTCAETSHQVTIKTLWLHFLGRHHYVHSTQRNWADVLESCVQTRLKKKSTKINKFLLQQTICVPVGVCWERTILQTNDIFINNVQYTNRNQGWYSSDSIWKLTVPPLYFVFPHWLVKSSHQHVDPQLDIQKYQVFDPHKNQAKPDWLYDVLYISLWHNFIWWGSGKDRSRLTTGHDK